MEILQMNTYELRGFILREIQENPVLEAEQTSPPYEDAALLERRLEWLSSLPERRAVAAVEADDPVMELASRITSPLWEDTLEAHLKLQLPALGLCAEEEHCARYLILCVDDRGFLDEDASATAKVLGVPEEVVSRVLALLRTLDPPGICARDLPGCLAAQLKDTPDCETALAIVANHLEDLARGRYAVIAKALGVSADRVRRACAEIRKLDPTPGAAFSQEAAPATVVPDVVGTRTEDGFDVALNDRMLPELGVSAYYGSLLKSSDSNDVRSYLAERFQRARWLMSCVEQRRGTLLACARAIVTLQADYFSGKCAYLAPMVLSDVAARLRMHPSTVSRAVRGKTLQFGASVSPMKSLFSRGVGTGEGERSSSDEARSAIRRFVDNEDKKHPLSDQRLCELLSREGLALSRRTGAKYRDELGISGTAARRVR
jgi:RNA polymerase sigma-54 factor